MKHPKLLVLACLAVLAVTACNKPAAPAAPAEPASAPAAATDAANTPAAVANAVPFDQKGFAGVFKGTLACADCKGTDTTLELKPDGSYVISENYQGKSGGAKMDGTWTAESEDQHIRLDPNSKSEDDRVFAITTNNQLDQLGRDGLAFAAGTPSALKREGAAK